jgi:hypothetical protein
MYLVANYLQRYCLQRVTSAGPGDTLARIDGEQGIMSGALYQFFVHIEELVFLPFQVGAGMWAFIVIGIELAIFVHDEDRVRLAFDLRFKTFTAGVFYIGCSAEHGVGKRLYIRVVAGKVYRGLCLSQPMIE